MEVIEVPAGSHDLKKLFKRTAPFRQSSFVGRQVARDDVRKPWDQREMLAAAEIILRIDLCRVLAKVGDSTRHPFELGHAQGCASVATIAIDLRIDDVAPQSHQGTVFPGQIQRDRGYCETLLNS